MASSYGSSRLSELQRKAEETAINIQILQEELALKELEQQDIEDQIDEELENLEQQRILSLSSAFYDKLPNELRQTVYEYATIEETPFFINTPDWEPKMTILVPAYVGQHVAAEAAEIFYTRNQFYIHQHDFLVPFLTSDPYGSGFRACDFIRAFSVTINPWKLEEAIKQDGPDGPREVPYLEDMRETFDEVSRVLPRGDDMHIQIGIHTSLDKDTDDPRRAFINVMEALRKPVYELLHTECTVDIEHIDVFSWWRNRSLNRFFWMGAEDYAEQDGDLKQIVYLQQELESVKDQHDIDPFDAIADRWGVDDVWGITEEERCEGEEGEWATMDWDDIVDEGSEE